jgi:hypothetical protein
MSSIENKREKSRNASKRRQGQAVVVRRRKEGKGRSAIEGGRWREGGGQGPKDVLSPFRGPAPPSRHAALFTLFHIHGCMPLPPSLRLRVCSFFRSHPRNASPFSCAFVFHLTLSLQPHTYMLSYLTLSNVIHTGYSALNPTRRLLGSLASRAAS